MRYVTPSATFIEDAYRRAVSGTLADLEEIPGESEVRRDDLQRNVQVTARFEKVDARFDAVDRELGLVKDAVLTHDRELREMGRGTR